MKAKDEQSAYWAEVKHSGADPEGPAPLSAKGYGVGYGLILITWGSWSLVWSANSELMCTTS
jgi:hypothetical protein